MDDLAIELEHDSYTVDRPEAFVRRGGRLDASGGLAELPIDLDPAVGGTVNVYVGPARRRGTFWLAAGAATLIAIAVAMGVNRSAPIATPTPRRPVASPATTLPMQMAPSADLARFVLRGFRDDGVGFAVDLSTGMIDYQHPQALAAPDPLNPVLVTSTGFVFMGPRAELITFTGNNIMSTGGDQIVPADDGYAVVSPHPSGRLVTLHDGSGAPLGAVAIPNDGTVEGVTGGQVVISTPQGLFTSAVELNFTSDGPVTPPYYAARGELVGLGAGMIAYRDCAVGAACPIVFASATGTTRVVSTLAANQIGDARLLFTADGSHAVTLTAVNGTLRAVIVDTGNGASLAVDAGPGLASTTPSLSLSGRFLTWRTNKHTVGYAALAPGGVHGAVSLPFDGVRVAVLDDRDLP